MTGPTDRTRLRRKPSRGSHELDTIAAILDAGRVCHVGLVDDDGPVVIPMSYVRDGDRLLLHGAPRSRLMRRLAEGAPVCVAVTHLDGIVLARSGFHSSMNYRSAVVFGAARAIDDPDRKRAALDRLVDGLVPGRSAEVRAASEAELAATTIVELAIDEASAKIRSGPPSEPDEDARLPIWAGVVPLTLRPGPTEPAPDLDPAVPLPDSVRRLGTNRG